MKALKIAGRVLSIFITVVMLFLLICNVYNIAVRYITGEQLPRLFGYSTAVVVSGSMSGSIEVNDMVLNRSMKSYGIGDIITYKHGDIYITHRVVDITDKGYITQGDANNTEDTEAVKAEDIVGKVVLVIPKIGAVIGFIRTPLGMMLLLFICVAMIELPVIFERRTKKRSGSSEN